LISPDVMSWASQELIRSQKMISTEELDPIDAGEAREAVQLLLSEGKSLWKIYEDDFGEVLHWLGLSHTALEPLPKHQERFRLLCGNKRRPAGERLSAGIHILDSALKKMDTDQVNLENPSALYRRLIMSLPD
jgi:hypothetical protein